MEDGAVSSIFGSEDGSLGGGIRPCSRPKLEERMSSSILGGSSDPFPRLIPGVYVDRSGVGDGDPPPEMNRRWSRKPRPQPQKFSKLVFLMTFG